MNTEIWALQEKQVSLGASPKQEGTKRLTSSFRTEEIFTELGKMRAKGRLIGVSMEKQSAIVTGRANSCSG